MLSALLAIILLVSFPLFALMQKVEQKIKKKANAPLLFQANAQGNKLSIMTIVYDRLVSLDS